MTTCHCCATDREFTVEVAERDLRRFRRVLERHGLARRWTGGTWIWAAEAEVFERTALNPNASS